MKIEYIYRERERDIDFLSCFNRFSLISIDNGLLSISKKKYPVLSALTENYIISKNWYRWPAGQHISENKAGPYTNLPLLLRFIKPCRPYHCGGSDRVRGPGQFCPDLSWSLNGGKSWTWITPNDGFCEVLSLSLRQRILHRMWNSEEKSEIIFQKEWSKC